MAKKFIPYTAIKVADLGYKYDIPMIILHEKFRYAFGVA